MADGDEEPKKRQRTGSGEQECQRLDLEIFQDVESILQDWIIGGSIASVATVAGARPSREDLQSAGSPLPWLLMWRACGVSPQTLNLRHQEIRRAGAKRLALALASGVCDGLQTLDLRSNNIGNSGVMWVMRSLARCRASRTVRTLVLRCNDIDTVGVSWLAMALTAGVCGGLKTLDLEENQFGPAGVAWLAVGLASGACTGLQTLNLRSNDMQDAGVTWLAKALRSGTWCRELQVLNLVDNQIGDRGAEQLAVALASGACRGLQTLHLEFNDVMEAGPGAERLMEALSGGACGATVDWGHSHGAP